MKIKVITIGKFNDASYNQLFEEFEKRIQRYHKFESVIINPLKLGGRNSEDQIRKSEGEAILSKLQSNDFLVLLDEKGKRFTSAGFADYLQQHFNSQPSDMVFVIGGGYGFSEAIYDRSNAKMSMSEMTFPHQLARLVFLEQLYRAFTILKNEPYHHE